ncbi:hypothetical protein UXP46_23255 [Enterobacter ludwigii]|uniref:hypothetical protein n=1 Tax=Enterobacter ludwigii TaxID=299767 RepID=UPI002FD74B08
MKINNFSVIFKWRLLGLALSFSMAVAANMYLKLPLLYVLVVWNFMLTTVFHIRKDSPRIKALNESCRNNLRLIMGALLVSCIIGFVAFLGEARLEERIASLLFPIVVLDLIMSVLLLLFSYSHTKWQRAGPAQGSVMYAENGQIAAAYADSEYDLMSNEIYWPQSDYHTSAFSSDSFDINPSTGQTMVGMYDTSGCLYGYSDPVFTDDHHNTNQFSDFDYHNNQ